MQKDEITDNLRMDSNDALIEIFQAFAEGGIEADITLLVGGQIITGTVIRPKKYLHLFTEKLRTANSNLSTDFLNALASAFTQDEESTVLEEKGLDDEKLAENLVDRITFRFENPNAYIHLSNVSIYHPSDQISFPYLRIRMSSIDGHCLGRLS